MHPYLAKSKSILVIGPAWIGDMIMAQTLFKLIKSRNSATAIDVLAPFWTLPLLERMSEVRTALSFPFNHGDLKLKKRYTFAKSLRQRKYDQAIVLPGSFKSALTALWAKIPVRTGWVGECRYGLLNDVRHLDHVSYPLMIQQFAALGLEKTESLPRLEPFYPQLSINEQHQDATINKFAISRGVPILALCPGAEFGPAKRWPIRHFATVANAMLNTGWQVFILGSKKDSLLAKDLMIATHHQCIDFTGSTTLIEAVDILSLASAVITNDSGLMHISAALHRPLVATYGSSSPTFTPPLFKKATVVSLSLDCSPCFKRECPLGHFDCMEKMMPDLILSKLRNLIND